MKKYILTDDIYCIYLTKSKKNLIDFTKGYLQNGNRLKDLGLYSIKYNSKKIDIDNFFGDIIAIDKQNDDSIEYDDYVKHGIIDGLCKKDFLYHNL